MSLDISAFIADLKQNNYCHECGTKEEMDKFYQDLAISAGQNHRLEPWCGNFSFPYANAMHKWVKINRWSGFRLGEGGNREQFFRIYIEFPASNGEAKAYQKRYKEPTYT